MSEVGLRHENPSLSHIKSIDFQWILVHKMKPFEVKCALRQIHSKVVRTNVRISAALVTSRWYNIDSMLLSDRKNSPASVQSVLVSVGKVMFGTACDFSELNIRYLNMM